MLEHLLIHVALLEVHLAQLELIGSIILGLSVLEPGLKRFLSCDVCLANTSLPLLLVLDLSLVFLEIKLELELLQLGLEFMILVSAENLRLDLELLAFLEDLSLLKEELLACLLLLHLNLVNVDTFLLIDLCFLFRNLKTVLTAHLIDLILDLQLEQSGFLSLALTIVRLQVFEKLV